MKIILLSILISLFGLSPNNPPSEADKHPSFNKSECTCKGKFLSGIVRIVEYNEDFRVKIVEYNEDLIVHKSNSSAPSTCGYWNFNQEMIPKFTIKS